MACLCAPTTHEGSFRCRLHRGTNPIITNPALNYQKGVCGRNLISDQSCASYITARESPSASAPHPFDVDDRSHAFSCHAAYMPQVAAHHQSSSRARLSSSSSSSSPISTSTFRCNRPPPAKKPPLSSSSSPSKSPYAGSPPAPSTRSCLTASSGTSLTNASHAAALAIMKQHLHNKPSRNHNRNTLRSPAEYSKIGPSRLSRMVVACAEELPIPKEDHCMSNSSQHSNGTSDMSGAFADARGFASFQAPMQISLKTRSSVNKFKQSETSCRIVGSKGGSLIMPTVY